MRWRSAGLFLLVLALAGLAAAAIAVARGSRVAPGDLRQQVIAAERAFAASMARRDFDAFTEHLSREAVFMRPGGALRGILLAILAALFVLERTLTHARRR